MARTRRKKKAPEGSTRAIGDVLEEIVAAMHEVEGVLVERNVFLPVHNGGRRTREIDVLITSQTAGIPVRIAIECKNEIKKTGVEKIDAFIGKLKDVNLPTQLGIYVSKSGHTKGAIERANEEGIKTLILEDLSKDITGTVIQAFQSTVYLLPAITNIQVVNDIGTTAPISEILFFRDRSGKVCGSIPDLVWKEWVFEKIPAKIGEINLRVKKPAGWIQIIQGQEAKIKSILVSLQITGFGVTFAGLVSQHKLINASDHSLDKSQLVAKFTPPLGKQVVSQFDTEDSLEKFKENKGQIYILNRIRAPRIRWLSMYWPPSSSTILKLNQRMQNAHQKDEIFDLNSITLTEIEGDSLSKLWEPIVKDHPMLNQIRKTWNSKTK